MNELLTCDAAPSLGLYFAAQNPANNTYFDFEDSLFKALAHEAVAAVTTGSAGSGAFKVAGNITSALVAGQHVRVLGSAGGANDGIYTIRSGSSYTSPNTTINVVEAVSSSSVSGTIDLNCTPGLSTTESANGGGAGVSTYFASLNLAAINPTTTLGQYTVQALEPTDTTTWPVPDADTPQSGKLPLTVQLGLPGPQEIVVRFQVGTTSTNGNNTQLSAWLECNGSPVALATVDPDATAAAAVVLFGETPEFDVTTANFGSANADNRFEYLQPTTGFVGDQTYIANVTIVANGNTFTGQFPFTVFP